MEYFKINSLNELFQISGKCSGPVRLLAGGTDIMHRFKKQFLRKEGLTLLDLNGLNELKVLRDSEESLEIGSLTTLSTLHDSLVESGDFSLLRKALSLAACPQIRNRGTLGGHIAGCLPQSHLFPALLLYDASLRILTEKGERIESLESVFRRPYHTSLKKGEVITSILLKKKRYKWVSYWGEGERKALCFAPFVLAMALDSESNAYLAGGALKERPVRFSILEASLAKGNSLTKAALKDEFKYQSEAGNGLSDYQKTLLYRLASNLGNEAGL